MSGTAQNGSGKIALLIPNIYGPDGLTLQNPDHFAHFTSSFQSSFTPFNAAMARQLTSLPIPSPASGFSYSFDPALGVYTRSAKSLGPILAERAETIGKDKFLFGLSYQHFAYNSMDGVSLQDVPAVFTHAPSTNIEYVKDIITTYEFYRCARYTGDWIPNLWSHQSRGHLGRRTGHQREHDRDFACDHSPHRDADGN